MRIDPTWQAAGSAVAAQIFKVTDDVSRPMDYAAPDLRLSLPGCESTDDLGVLNWRTEQLGPRLAVLYAGFAAAHMHQNLEADLLELLWRSGESARILALLCDGSPLGMDRERCIEGHRDHSWGLVARYRGPIQAIAAALAADPELEWSAAQGILAEWGPIALRRASYGGQYADVPPPAVIAGLWIDRGPDAIQQLTAGSALQGSDLVSLVGPFAVLYTNGTSDQIGELVERLHDMRPMPAWTDLLNLQQKSQFAEYELAARGYEWNAEERKAKAAGGKLELFTEVVQAVYEAVIVPRHPDWNGKRLNRKEDREFISSALDWLFPTELLDTRAKKPIGQVINNHIIKARALRPSASSRERLKHGTSCQRR